MKPNRRPTPSYPEKHPLLHDSPNPIPRPQPKLQNWSNNTGQQGQSDGTWRPQEYPMICFACVQPGHKASYCQAKKQNPNKDLATANIHKVGEHNNQPVSSPLAPNCMKGEVNPQTATILVDSGAQRTIIKASLVNAADYTGESIPITTFILEEAVSRPLANITTTTTNITLFRQAAVVDDHMMMGSEDVLLSISPSSTEKPADLLLDGEPYMPNLPAIINVTRA